MIDFACKEFDLEEIIKCGFGLTKAELSVFMFLVKSKKGFCSTEEISTQTRLNLTTIQKAMKKMYDQGILARQQKNRERGGYIFEYQIKSKSELRELVKKVIRNWSKQVESEIDTW